MRNQADGNAAAMKAEPGAGEVEARPIADFAPAVTSRRVNFLKIDVEGFELHGELYCSTSDDSVLATNKLLPLTNASLSLFCWFRDHVSVSALR